MSLVFNLFLYLWFGAVLRSITSSLHCYTHGVAVAHLRCSLEVKWVFSSVTLIHWLIYDALLFARFTLNLLEFQRFGVSSLWKDRFLRLWENTALTIDC